MQHAFRQVCLCMPPAALCITPHTESHPFSFLPSSPDLARVAARQGPAALEATATGHAMLALLTAEQMRLKYRGAADEQISPSRGSKNAADLSTQLASSTGLAYTGSKQSAKGREGSNACADKAGTWQQCLQHAHAAAQAWQGCLHADTVEGACGCEGVTDADTLPQLMLELLYMAGLHGKICYHAFGFAIPMPIPSPLLYLNPSPILLFIYCLATRLPTTTLAFGDNPVETHSTCT